MRQEQAGELGSEAITFERYSEKARRVIFFARYEASQFGSPAIDTEHLLLGILRESRDLLLSVSPSAGAETIRERIRLQAPGGDRIPTSVDLPFSESAKRALNSATEEADRLGSKTISAQYLLLGLLREENCLAQRILAELGVTLETARQIDGHRESRPVLDAAGSPGRRFFRDPPVRSGPLTAVQTV